MPADDALHRQLRFSLFLQSFAALMLGGSLVIRAAVLGWDLVTGLLAAGVLVVAGAIGFTVRRLRG